MSRIHKPTVLGGLRIAVQGLRVRKNKPPTATESRGEPGEGGSRSTGSLGNAPPAEESHEEGE